MGVMEATQRRLGVLPAQVSVIPPDIFISTDMS
jgi:hypothetical protein